MNRSALLLLLVGLVSGCDDKYPAAELEIRTADGWTPDVPHPGLVYHEAGFSFC